MTLPARLPTNPVPRAMVEYLSGLTSDASRTVSTQRLRGFSSWLSGSPVEDPDLPHFPWLEVTSAHLKLFMADLREKGRSPATINGYLASVRAFLDHLPLPPAEKLLISKVKQAKGSRVAKGRAIDDSELRAMLGKCGRDSQGLRDRALLLLLADTGCRRAEAVGVNWEALGGEGEALVVRGKGDKERELFLSGEAWGALETLRVSLGNPPAGPVFCNPSTGQRLTPQSVRLIVRKLGGSTVNPHDFRRTVVTKAFRAGYDAKTIRTLTGHSNTATLERYNIVERDRVRGMVEELAGTRGE